MSEDGVEITPYDRWQRGEDCPAIDRLVTHDANIRFETAGPKVIQVNGRRIAFIGGKMVEEIVQKSFSMTVE